MPTWLRFESPDPSSFKGVRSKALSILSGTDERESLAEELSVESEVTLHRAEPN